MDKLEALKHPEMARLLHNKALQEILTEIDTAENRESALLKYHNNHPLFVEFSQLVFQLTGGDLYDLASR